MPRDDDINVDMVDGLVRRAMHHLTEAKRQQLETAIQSWRQLFVASKEDLQRTDIV